jgi:hypothetical protein
VFPMLNCFFPSDAGWQGSWSSGWMDKTFAASRRDY